MKLCRKINDRRKAIRDREKNELAVWSAKWRAVRRRRRARWITNASTRVVGLTALFNNQFGSWVPGKQA